jgi:membrane associated rhomboid family serine protease
MSKWNKSEISKFRELFLFPTLLVLTIWAVEVIEYYGEYRFVKYGIYPRDVSTLTGIMTAPFVHSDWGHLISNTFPTFILSSLMMTFYRKLIVPVYAGVFLLTGFSVWLFARESYHIGISGVVYGLIGFIFWSGLFRDNIRSTILSLVILIIYSGYFNGLMPEEGVSWESHLFGGLSGAFFAFFYKNMETGYVEDEPQLIESEPISKAPFFVADIFERTKQERMIDHLLEEE